MKGRKQTISIHIQLGGLCRSYKIIYKKAPRTNNSVSQGHRIQGLYTKSVVFLYSSNVFLYFSNEELEFEIKIAPL